jgi:hypothetical protein
MAVKPATLERELKTPSVPGSFGTGPLTRAQAGMASSAQEILWTSIYRSAVDFSQALSRVQSFAQREAVSPESVLIRQASRCRLAASPCSLADEGFV